MKLKKKLFTSSLDDDTMYAQTLLNDDWKKRRDVGMVVDEEGSKRKKKGLFILRRKGAKLCIWFRPPLLALGDWIPLEVNKNALMEYTTK